MHDGFGIRFDPGGLEYKKYKLTLLLVFITFFFCFVFYITLRIVLVVSRLEALVYQGVGRVTRGNHYQTATCQQRCSSGETCCALGVTSIKWLLLQSRAIQPPGRDLSVFFHVSSFVKGKKAPSSISASGAQGLRLVSSRLGSELQHCGVWTSRLKVTVH